MKAKFAGTCKKTGRRFGVGDKIKWLGKGKGAELISYAKKSNSNDGYDGTSSNTPEWQNDAGEPLYNPIAGWRADDEYNYYRD